MSDNEQNEKAHWNEQNKDPVESNYFWMQLVAALELYLKKRNKIKFESLLLDFLSEFISTNTGTAAVQFLFCSCYMLLSF